MLVRARQKAAARGASRRAAALRPGRPARPALRRRRVRRRDRGLGRAQRARSAAGAGRDGARDAARRARRLSRVDAPARGPRPSLPRGVVRPPRPRLGRLVAGEGSAYEYLPASVRDFPDADGLAAPHGRGRPAPTSATGASGFGAVALHVAEAPDDPCGGARMTGPRQTLSWRSRAQKRRYVDGMDAVEARLQAVADSYAGPLREACGSTLAAGGKRVRPLLTLLSRPPPRALAGRGRPRRRRGRAASHGDAGPRRRPRPRRAATRQGHRGARVRGRHGGVHGQLPAGAGLRRTGGDGRRDGGGRPQRDRRRALRGRGAAATRGVRRDARAGGLPAPLRAQDGRPVRRRLPSGRPALGSRRARAARPLRVRAAARPRLPGLRRHPRRERRRVAARASGSAPTCATAR